MGRHAYKVPFDAGKKEIRSMNYFEQQHCLSSQEACTLATTPKNEGCRMTDEGSIKAALNSHLGAQAIQCDERDAPQCFSRQPTSRNNSAREGSTAGVSATERRLDLSRYGSVEGASSNNG